MAERKRLFAHVTRLGPAHFRRAACIGGIAWVAWACDAGGFVMPVAGDGPSLDLAIAMAVDNPAPLEGATVTFTLTVTNNGPIDALGVVAADTLPTGLAYVSHDAQTGAFSPGSGLWDIGSLEVGSQAVLALMARPRDGTAGQALTNRAGVLSTVHHDSISGNNVAQTTLNVQAPPQDPPPTGSLVFQSDWSNALGNQNAALQDGGRWSEAFCSGRHDVLSVVPGGSLGWTRTPNVFRVLHTGRDGDCGAIQRRNALPAQTTHWGRLYYRSDKPGYGRSMHNFSYNFVGNIQGIFFNPNGRQEGWFTSFVWNHQEWARQTWLLKSGPGNPSDPADATGISDPRAILLPHGQWFRYEWQIEYVAGGRMRLWPRIYNMAGTLLYDASNWYPLWHGSMTLAQWYQSGNSFPVGSMDLMRHIGIGNEGRAGGSPNQFWYVADFALSLDGWIGSN